MRSGGRWRGMRPVHVLLSRAELGESPLLPAAAIVSSAGLYATLPARFVVGPSAGIFSVARWFVPGLTVLLFVVLVATVPHGRVVRALGTPIQHVHVRRRRAVMGGVALVTAANAGAVVLLVHLLITGAQVDASQLLRAGVHMWCLNVLVFSLWFWQLDNGGPVARATAGPEGRDFLFPQQATPELGQPNWQPRFLDYLYLAYTNATAFSPTDAMPLSRWAKMLMLIESMASLLLAIVVAARAVNILK